MKRLALIIAALGGLTTAAYAIVGSPVYRPAGSDGYVQIKSGPFFAGRHLVGSGVSIVDDGTNITITGAASSQNYDLAAATGTLDPSHLSGLPAGDNHYIQNQTSFIQNAWFRVVGGTFTDIQINGDAINGITLGKDGMGVGDHVDLGYEGRYTLFGTLFNNPIGRLRYYVAATNGFSGRPDGGRFEFWGQRAADQFMPMFSFLGATGGPLGSDPDTFTFGPGSGNISNNRPIKLIFAEDASSGNWGTLTYDYTNSFVFGNPISVPQINFPDGSHFTSANAIISVQDLVASGVIGSNSGNYNIHGATVAFGIPPVDGLNRLMVLNNGAVTFPVMATGADLNAYNLFAASADFNAAGGIGVLYGISVGSITITGLTASQYVKTDSGKKLTTVAGIPASDLIAGAATHNVMVDSITASAIQTAVTAGTNITITNTANGVSIAASGGGSSGSAAVFFGTGTTAGWTGTITSSPTAGVLFDKNYFSGTVQGGSTMYYTFTTTGEGWPWMIPSTHTSNTADFTVPATGTNTITGYQFATQANSTYTWIAFINGHSNSSATSGITISPLISNVAQSHMRCGGASTASTAARFDQGSDVSGTPTTNALSAYGSATTNELVCSGQFSTGAGAGNFQLQVVNKSAAGTFTCEAGGQLHGWRIAPLP